MMNYIKKPLALIMAVVTLLSFSCASFAADDTDSSIRFDNYGFRTALDIAFKGIFEKIIIAVSRGFVTAVTGRKVSYND